MILAFLAATTALAAGSGRLWYRYSSVPDVWPTLRVDAAGPLTITVISEYSSASLYLEVLNSAGTVVHTLNLIKAELEQTVVVPQVAAGVYRLRINSDPNYGGFRFATSAPKFALPGGIDFLPDYGGDYYFFVPADVTSFDFRLHTPDVGEKGSANLYRPDGSLAASVEHDGSTDRSYTIPVPPAAAGRHWRVAVGRGLGDLRFYVRGVPDVFAESVAAWFDPSAEDVGPVTHFRVAVPNAVDSGDPFDFTVTALSASNEPVPDYAGTVTVSADDVDATLPGPLAVTGGSATGQMTLRTEGTRSVHATDSTNPAASGSANPYVVGPPGSGEAWIYRPWSGSRMRFDVPAPGLETFTVISGPPGGNVEVHVLDACVKQIFTQTLSFSGAGQQDINVSFASAGTHFLELATLGTTYTLFKVRATVPRFVIPSGIDLKPPAASPLVTYYFRVPADAESFRVMLGRGDDGHYTDSQASIQGPDGIERLLITKTSDDAWTIRVDAASRGAIWRVVLALRGNARFFIYDIPGWLAATPDSWFGQITPCEQTWIRTHDVDGDGRSDIVWQHRTTGSVYRWAMNGYVNAAGTPIADVPDLNWKIATIGDFDGDGDSDLFWRHAQTGDNYVYLMQDGRIAWRGYINVVPDLNWKILGSGDMSGDGKADVLWRHATTDEFFLYVMNGTNIVQYVSITKLPLNYAYAGMDDIDGDGFSDIILCHVDQWTTQFLAISAPPPYTTVRFWGLFRPEERQLDDSVVLSMVRHDTGERFTGVLTQSYAGVKLYMVHRNGFTTYWGLYALFRVHWTWKIAGAGDYNGDGSDDILWRNSVTGENYMYLMPGVNGGLYTGHAVRSDPGLDWQIVR